MSIDPPSKPKQTPAWALLLAGLIFLSASLFALFGNRSTSLFNNEALLLMQLALSLILLATALLLGKFRPSWLELTILFLFAYPLVSQYLFSPRLDAPGAYFRTLAFPITALMAITLLYTEKAAQLVFPATITLLLLAPFYYLYSIHITWTNAEDPINYPWTWGNGLFPNIRHLGHICALCACAAIIALNHRFRAIRMTALFSLTVSMGIIAWSGTRLSLLVLMLCVPCAYLFKFRALIQKSHILLATLMGIAASTLFPVNDPSLGLLRFTEKIGTDLNHLSSGRIEIWHHVYQLSLEKVFTGWGAESYRLLKLAPSTNQAHNGILQLWLEWGIIAPAAIYIPFIFLAATTFRKTKNISNTESSLTTLSFFLFLSVPLLHSLIDGAFYHQFHLFFLSITLFMGLHLHKATELSTKRPARPEQPPQRYNEAQ